MTVQAGETTAIVPTGGAAPGTVPVDNPTMLTGAGPRVNHAETASSPRMAMPPVPA